MKANQELKDVLLQLGALSRALLLRGRAVGPLVASAEKAISRLEAEHARALDELEARCQKAEAKVELYAVLERHMCLFDVSRDADGYRIRMTLEMALPDGVMDVAAIMGAAGGMPCNLPELARYIRKT